MKFYLSDNGERQVIDEEPHGKIEQECEAPCWVAAKAAMGFDLTPVQEILAEKMAPGWLAALRKLKAAA